jgi:hypothetical protein
VSPLKIKISGKNMREKPIHQLFIQFINYGITLPSSGSVPSGFLEMLN